MNAIAPLTSESTVSFRRLTFSRTQVELFSSGRNIKVGADLRMADFAIHVTSVQGELKVFDAFQDGVLLSLGRCWSVCVVILWRWHSSTYLCVGVSDSVLVGGRKTCQFHRLAEWA
jgi:hypothetical protein